MKRIVIGTAGHIDHGKTALVKALTGVDTDRLKEEKRRGITIELGFAHLDLGDGTVAGIVDVPGHERFVKAMAAGASGIDLVTLVIAADEGVMPQTREHLDICRLLGVPRGLVVLNKSDLLADLGPEWLDLLKADVAEACLGTFLEGAPMLAVSARTGEGIEELKKALLQLAKEAPERPTDGPTYLPVDRAFSLKGFGTVVTGTLLSGSVAPEDELDLLPGGTQRLRVRSVQVHGHGVPRALAGQRTAVNLSGIEAREIERGMVAVRSGVLRPTSMLDVELDLLAAAPKPLGARSKLLLHLGTAQVPAVVALLSQSELAPGAHGFAQLRLTRPVVALPGQLVILRGFTILPGRGQTVAGGRVLDVHPRKRRRSRADSAQGLDALAGDDPSARISFLLESAGFKGLTAQELFARTGLPERALSRTLEVMSSRGAATLFDKERRAFAAPVVIERLCEKAMEAVTAHRQSAPLAPGLPREELRQRLAPSLDPRLFGKVLGLLAERGALVAEGDIVRDKSAPAKLERGDADLKDQIARTLFGAGLCPPYLDELPRLTGADPDKVSAVAKVLEKEGRAVRVSQDMYFDAAAVQSLKERLIAFLKLNKRITTQEFKELVHATRKYAIPLSEYFDRERVTLRVGDARVLRGADGGREH
ncbi:MAG: selenocysteine-specific translation elongation factor [Deltaproteobacteria bacterium]|nr:selenocysteine-specific translation elongation factor [Deltaproteobacteria bacterium]